jgi:hypothetical protein
MNPASHVPFLSPALHLLGLCDSSISGFFDDNLNHRHRRHRRHHRHPPRRYHGAE